MALRAARPLQAFRFSRVLRAGGGDDGKPRWTIPEADYHKYTYQPSIPDKHFYVGHWNYAPISMWVRARRPTMEKVIGDMYSTVTCGATSLWSPVQAVIEANLPGFGYKVLGVIGALFGYNLAVMYVTDQTEAYMFLEKMKLYAAGDYLVHKGFFMSDAEDAEAKAHSASHTKERLEGAWEAALADATQARSFEKLCEHLAAAAPIEVPKPISWRFSMMPYGRDSPDTTTTGYAVVDSPAANSTPILDTGTTGDYIDRQDNKTMPIRLARHFYAAAYAPPTK